MNERGRKRAAVHWPGMTSKVMEVLGAMVLPLWPNVHLRLTMPGAPNQLHTESGPVVNIATLALALALRLELLSCGIISHLL